MVGKEYILESLKGARSKRLSDINIKPELISLSFNNFKPFSDKKSNKIEIKPITLLFGWNNSGKTSILELIQLLSKINQQTNDKNSFFEFNANELLNLGSYKNFIFGNNVDNDLKITYALQNIRPSVRLKNTYGFDPTDELIKLITNSKTELKLVYSSSPQTNDNHSSLKSMGVEHSNLFSLEASRREYDKKSFNISKLEFKKMDTNNFFKHISINRSKITSILDSIKSEVYKSDIDFGKASSIGSQIRYELKKLQYFLKLNIDLIDGLEKEDKISSLIVLRRLMSEEELSYAGGYPELNRFLVYFYEYDQYKVLKETYSAIREILSNASNLDSDEIINLIENIFSYLDTDLLINNKYIKLINSYFESKELDQKIHVPDKNLDERFWEEFSKYLPKELQKGFISSNDGSKGKKIKTPNKQIKEFREIVTNFLSIDRQYLEIKKTLLFCMNSVQDANRKIKNIYPANTVFMNFSMKNEDQKVPLVKIDIDEIDQLIDLLNNFDKDTEVSKLNEIKRIFYSSLEKSIIIDSNINSSRISINNCLTLSSFLISIIENEAAVDDDKFYYFIENFSSILQSVFSSKQISIKAQSFMHPTDSIKRYYEKKDISKDLIHEFKYDFEKVFNILNDDEDVLKKVNDALKKMGFDFEINFKTIKGLNDENLFYPLAKNLTNESINTHIADMGLGLKKIIPLITYLYSKNWNGLICIQEPESNLHPKYQSEITEVLVDSYNLNKNYHIVETHSEILVLRLLKLIKQKKIEAKDVSINFIQKKDGESEIINIGLNDDGEFITKWPKGFFKERLDEIL